MHLQHGFFFKAQTFIYSFLYYVIMYAVNVELQRYFHALRERCQIML